ncbi:DUF4190 domain-containing protein [Clavibacter lycopersici]|nr:DUF4190 domain-containing protein [Clavibacter lycopersici]
MTAPDQPGHPSPDPHQPPSPGPYGPPAPAGSPIASSPPPYGGRPQGLAIAALVVGILAFLAGLAPVIGIVMGAAAVVLGILAVRRRQSKGMAITGLSLGAMAAVSSLAVTIAFAIIPSTTSESSGTREAVHAVAHLDD